MNTQQETNQETYKAVYQRIKLANDVNEYVKLERTIDNLYHNNCLTVDSYRRLLSYLTDCLILAQLNNN